MSRPTTPIADHKVDAVTSPERTFDSVALPKTPARVHASGHSDTVERSGGTVASSGSGIARIEVAKGEMRLGLGHFELGPEGKFLIFKQKAHILANSRQLSLDTQKIGL
jgi:hypothetical protein